MRKPMPVTTRIMTRAERVEQEAPVGGEARHCPPAVWNGRPASQVNWINWWVRPGSEESCHTAPAEKMKESSTMPGQNREMNRLPAPL